MFVHECTCQLTIFRCCVTEVFLLLSNSLKSAKPFFLFSDMVHDVVLDYMHLVLLGVVRRMVMSWTTKGSKKSTRLGDTMLDAISRKLKDFSDLCPQEFGRKSRSLDDISMWKATEFRQFLCYSFVAACRNVLEIAQYEHFLVLVCAMRILLHPTLCQTHNDLADRMLKYFVEQTYVLYGPHFAVYNFHGLTHLATDAKNHGNLDAISSFPYENKLRLIKKLIRSSNNVLVQVVNRLLELEDLDVAPPPVFASKFIKLHETGPLADDDRYNNRDSKRYKAVYFEGIRYASDKGNCCIKIGKKIGFIRNVVENGGDALAVVSMFRRVSDLFTKPLQSSTVGIYAVGGKFDEAHCMVQLQKCTKCVYYPLGDNAAWNEYIVIEINSQMLRADNCELRLVG